MVTCTDCGKERPERARGIGRCLACAQRARGEKIAKRPFIQHNGVRYYRDAQGWRSSHCKGGKRLHTALWEEANGSIPVGHHLFCTDPDHPALGNIECRPAYAGMTEWRGRLHHEAKEQWRERLALTDLQQRPTRAEIAERLGVSLTSARLWCKRLDVPKAKPGPKPMAVPEQGPRDEPTTRERPPVISGAWQSS